jgi:hypothetical protein
LEKVVHREVFIQGDLVHPSIPIESIANLPTFSLGDVVDKRRDINGLPTFKPRGSPKGGLTPVAKGDGGGGIEDVHVVFGTRVCGAPPNLGVVVWHFSIQKYTGISYHSLLRCHKRLSNFSQFFSISILRTWLQKNNSGLQNIRKPAEQRLPTKFSLNQCLWILIPSKPCKRNPLDWLLEIAC